MTKYRIVERSPGKFYPQYSYKFLWIEGWRCWQYLMSESDAYFHTEQEARDFIDKEKKEDAHIERVITV